MDRRTLLRGGVGLVASAGLAGCLGLGSEDPPPRKAKVFDDVTVSGSTLQVQLLAQPEVESRATDGNSDLADPSAVGSLLPVGVARAAKGGRGATGRGEGGYSSAPKGRHGWAVWHGDVECEGARFEGEVNFDEAVFENDVSFDEARFEGPVRARAAEFYGDSNLLDDNTSFTGAAFADAADFRQAEFGFTHFEEATFEAEATFREVTVDGDADFDGAVFQALADFDEGRFDGDTSFAGVAFRGPARFRGVAFSGSAHALEDDVTFARSTFGDGADFDHARFRYVTFTGATFEGRAGFTETQFAADADFPEVHFGAAADFDEARFEQDADFSGARFDGRCVFRGVEFRGGANYLEDDVTFEGGRAFATAPTSTTPRSRRRTSRTSGSVARSISAGPSSRTASISGQRRSTAAPSSTLRGRRYRAAASPSPTIAGCAST